MKKLRDLRASLALAATFMLATGSTAWAAAKADTGNAEKKPADAVATSSTSVSSVTTDAAAAIRDDTVLRAFQDELKRTETRLKLKGHPTPYFTSYTIIDQEWYNIFGSFGALDRTDDPHTRTLMVDLRVGNRKLDSDSGGFSFDRDRGPGVSLDNNYDAIRDELWLRTDGAYKHAIESFESRKALLQQKKIPDLPDALADSPPVVSLLPVTHLQIDRSKWNDEVRAVSAVFKSYPTVINSEVTLLSRAQTRWFTNSEGSINRESEQGAVIGMTASAQAKDGMEVADFELFGSDKTELLPDEDFLKLAARGLAERVTALSNAPIIEDYRGPILFEGQAAGEFFAQSLTPSLVNPNEKYSRLSAFGIGSAGLKEKLGRRILPTSFTVVDDPLAREYKGAPLKGGYLVDDEGVKGQRITLVENGILKTLCSGRTPSRYIKESNGHWRNGGATPTILFVTATEGKPLSALKEQLIKMGKEDGLKYVLIARRITSLYLRFFNAGDPGFKSMRMGVRSGEVSVAAPTLVYRVNVDDGKEELVRGARFEHLSSRMWRDIVGVGDDTQPHLVLTAAHSGNSTSSSLVCPSILVSELDVTRSTQEGEKPMLLKNPYFEKSSSVNR